MNVNRLSKPHWWQECLRSAPTTKCVLAAALLILPALRAPVHADDPIAQWLKQDENDGQNDQVRPDLHALTDQNCKTFSRLGAIKQTATNWSSVEARSARTFSIFIFGS